MTGIEKHQKSAIELFAAIKKNKDRALFGDTITPHYYLEIDVPVDKRREAMDYAFKNGWIRRKAYKSWLWTLTAEGRSIMESL